MMNNLFNTIKSIGKLLLQSRPVKIHRQRSDGRQLVIMGNGPSLNKVIEQRDSLLKGRDTMAVNFAANTPQFFDIKPRYYTLADPHFFSSPNDPNVSSLMANLKKVDWPMTLFIPCKPSMVESLIGNDRIKIMRFNAIGIEGSHWLCRIAFNNKWGMPRPRNVLIPSIMIGIWLGYKEIFLVGADHSWTRSLWVDDNNRVVTNLPHYYADNDHEQSRVKALYSDIPLHALFHSYYVAFKAYHEIEFWARTRGVNIYNSTPQSFIDAFERRPL
ncbi:MAG: hypothetical protein NC082_08030 [Clostridiales bacterium]|nr:hypothetical protein [Clostridiales bacterium]